MQLPERIVEGEYLPAARGEEPCPTYDQIRRLEGAILACPQDVDFLNDFTTHEFCDGVYCRKFYMPAGTVVVGKMHKKENFFVLVQGEVSILVDDGKVRRIKAPYMTITRPGTKRVVYSHKDSLMMTFHGNPENDEDIKVLEEHYIVPECKPTLTHDTSLVAALLEKLQ